MVPSILIKEPGCQMRSGLTEKLAKVWKNTHAPYYRATLEEKQTDMHFKNGITNVFLRESSGG